MRELLLLLSETIFFVIYTSSNPSIEAIQECIEAVESRVTDSMNDFSRKKSFKRRR